MRVASVLPSATETVFAVGAGASLVGRSEECDYPSEVRRLPVVMRARSADFGRPSAEIDARVRAALRSGEGLYDLDVDLLARLAPDVILTQDLCRVCSVTDAEVVEACRLAGASSRIVSVSPTRLGEVWEAVATIGRAVGHAPEAERLRDDLGRESQPPSGSSGGPSVAVLEWVDPPILAGLWTPDSIRSAGGDPVGPAAGGPGSRIEWSALAAIRPDLIVVSPCSFGVERTRTELAQGPASGALRRLRPRLGTWIADEAHFSRPGPRLIEGVRLLRALLRGEAPSGALPAERWPGKED